MNYSDQIICAPYSFAHNIYAFQTNIVWKSHFVQIRVFESTICDTFFNILDCHLLFNVFKSEDGELGIEGLDKFLRVMGQESPIQELRAIMAEWGDKKAGKMNFEQFIDMLERQGESWKIVDELVEEHQLRDVCAIDTSTN